MLQHSIPLNLLGVSMAQDVNQISISRVIKYINRQILIPIYKMDNPMQHAFSAE